MHAQSIPIPGTGQSGARCAEQLTRNGYAGGRRLVAGQRLVIFGAGRNGMESASTTIRRGVSVHIVEAGANTLRLAIERQKSSDNMTNLCSAVAVH